MASAELFQKLQLRKKRTQLPLSKNPCSGSQASGKLSTACRMKILLRAALAGDRTTTSGGWHHWPVVAGQPYITHIIHPAPGVIS